VRYAADMHLNVLRIEGKMLDNHLYELADRYGFSSCRGGAVGRSKNGTSGTANTTPSHGNRCATKCGSSAIIQRFRVSLRQRQCTPPAVEQMYLTGDVGRELALTRISIRGRSHHSGAGISGVKMTDLTIGWRPFWLTDTVRGGAFWLHYRKPSPGPAVLSPPALEQDDGAAASLAVGNSGWNFTRAAASSAQTQRLHDFAR